LQIQKFLERESNLPLDIGKASFLSYLRLGFKDEERKLKRLGLLVWTFFDFVESLGATLFLNAIKKSLYALSFS
jgi:hypothetical protein